MPRCNLTTVTGLCDRLLKPDGFQDWDGAVNGLQVENSGRVTRIAAAVDASLTTIRMAVDAQADLLLVHHGLFWSKTHPWTGRRYECIQTLIQHDLAVYSSHLPLDAHPRLGNNAQLCAALGLRKTKPFFFQRNQPIGLESGTRIRRDALETRLTTILGHRPTVLPGGPDLCRRIGVVTGGAGNELRIAAQEGVDTFITGEGAHWTYALAEDLGINVFYGGHYATETFGVKALAAHLAAAFSIPWVFLDHPTGL
ncbi:MAG: Nif3-like dinuclear metal center hexameric protein [Verrucomicrobia bacterium]|nr:Nif3-like dinuclear metal center hexameric protein [Verrucomicrobiota bacterium]